MTDVMAARSAALPVALRAAGVTALDLDVNRLLVFLEALTDPAALDGGPVLRSVPSGLPVRD
jgi:hypothetical protein